MVRRRRSTRQGGKSAALNAPEAKRTLCLENGGLRNYMIVWETR